MKLLDMVRVLEGKDDLTRRRLTLHFLCLYRFKPILEEYRLRWHRGANILAAVGNGRDEILITTHYDVVRGSPGANDNGSCIAVLIDVFRKLKDHRPKNKIRLVIFDDEENGLRGSKAYVKRHGFQSLLGLYNTELVGMGDTVTIWPVTNQAKDHPALVALVEAITELGCPYIEAGKLPRFIGDHQTFQDAGFPGAFCLSMIPGSEIEKIRRYVNSLEETAKNTIPPQEIPLIFRNYHCPEDRSEYLSEEALQLMSEVIYRAVVRLDSWDDRVAPDLVSGGNSINFGREGGHHAIPDYSVP